jgi:hypothetical protein
MESVYKIRDMKGIDKLCVAHTHDLKDDSIILDAKKKIE